MSSEADQKPLTLEDEMKQQTATFQSKVLSLGTDSLHPLLLPKHSGFEVKLFENKILSNKELLNIVY